MGRSVELLDRNRKTIAALIDGVDVLIGKHGRAQRRNAAGHAVSGYVDVAPKPSLQFNSGNNAAGILKKHEESLQLLGGEMKLPICAEEPPVGFKTVISKRIALGVSRFNRGGISNL